jgi:hypothetical protein
MSSPESSFSNSISISVSLDDFCMPTLPSFKTFYSLFQTALLSLVSLTAQRFSSPDTPATASCKEKLLIALHKPLLIVLLDIWEQNILVFDEEWVGRLLDYPTIGVVERNF